MLERKIKRPDAETYITVTLSDDGQLGIEDIGGGKYTVFLDARVIDPLIPILQEFSFWRKTIEGK